MRFRAALGLALLLLGAAGVAIERSRDDASPRAAAVHPASASELEAGSGSVESLSQRALEERLDRLEQELSAGSSSFPSPGHVPAGPSDSNFGLD